MSFRPIELGGSIALVRFVNDTTLEVETQSRLTIGQRLTSAKLEGEFVVVESRQSHDQAPPYSWARLRAAAAFDEERAALNAAIEAASGEAPAPAPDSAGADSGESEPASPSPRSARRSKQPAAPTEETSEPEPAADPDAAEG